MTTPAREPHGPGFRRLALLSAALLSCTTIRTPVSTIEPAVAMREGRPEPQVELWVESNKPLTPEEAESYRSAARTALEKALADRAPPEGEGELVVIRAQGVTRTGGHKSDQTAATVGMVVGAVVIVAAVVVAIVMGGKSNSGGGGHSVKGLPSASAPRLGGSAGRATGASLGRAGAAAGAGAAVARLPRVPAVSAPRVPVARGFPVVPAPGRLPSAPAPGTPLVPAPLVHGYGAPPFHRSVGPSVDVEVGFWWMIPVGPPEPMVYDLPPEPAPPVDYPEEEPGEPARGMAAENDQLSLPPPDRYPVEDRGFFDGDRLVLEAVVVDRATGEALWVKRVSRKADPRDARAVKEAVDQLLANGGWQAPSAY